MDDRNQRWSDLLRRANRGDRAAYTAFLREIVPVLRGVVGARASGMREDAEDIVQEVLMAVHQKRHTWRESDPVTPWLYAIARYKAADAWRRRGITAAPSTPVDELADVLPAEGGEEPMAGRDLARLLSRIDERSATIVRAVGLEGASAGEVGERLGMTQGAVRVAYHRAMQRLTRLSRDEGGADGNDDPAATRDETR